MASPPNAAATTGQTVSNWVSQHRRLVVAVAAAVTVTTAGALYYSHASHQQQIQQAKQSKQAKKDAKAAGGSKGKGKGTSSSSPSSSTPAAGNEKQQASSSSSSDDALNLTQTDIEVMDKQTRAQTALTLKARGNKLYASKQYDDAIAYYTKAIECEEQAVFYSNRAACYTNLNQLDKVVEDCSAALRLDSQYVKALNRRATAREQLGGDENLYLALCDFTAAAILDGFQNQSTSNSVERVMKRLASEKASDMLATREARLPSATFVTAYLTAFRPRAPPSLPANPQQGDRTLQLAFEALDAKDFTHAFTLFHESIEQGLSTDEARSEALNMRATFKFIMSDATGALADLDEATRVKPDNAQSWVKKASVHMELGKPDEAMADFDRALEIDPENADVFYHRGQVFFITGEFDRAIQEYRKSSELDPSYIFCHIQLAVAQYKAGSTQKALVLFDRLVEKNPRNPDVYNYYGELLLDQQRFQDAVDAFDKAIEYAKDQTPRNVLPMVNKALAIFQHRQDFATAERICREAVTIDPQCDVGVATLAQLLLQQNKVHEAVDMFSKAAEMARTEPELVNALTYENATRAQLAFLRDYPEQAARLGLARTA